MQKSLNNFWSYIDNYFLRKPSADQIEKLAAMRAMLEEQIKDSSPIQNNDKAGRPSHQLLRDDYLNKFSSLEYQNLLKHIEISQKLFLNGEKRHWKTIDRILKTKEEIIPTKKKNYNALLEKEKDQLDELNTELGVLNLKDTGGISLEIEKLTEQLTKLNVQNSEGLKDLEDKVREEIKRNKVIFIVNNPLPAIQNSITPKKHKGRQPKGQPKQQKILLHLVRQPSWDVSDPKLRMQTQLKFIEYAYVDIQKKILAQSMSKLVGITKQRGSIKFEVVFDESMQLQSLFLSKEQLLRYNSLKQISLFKFYRVSGKCLYGNISQNIAGFTYIYKHLREPNLIKNSTSQEMITRLMSQPSCPPAIKQFNKFQICHNCQQLYHQNYLIQCNYRVVRPKWESGDPHAPKHKDLYTIKDGAYVCLRKYCHHCINTNYPNRKKNGLCPFCQDICYCPRCQKQSILTRFKGIYETAGGDVSRLQSLSIIAPLKKQTSQNECIRKKHDKEQPLQMNSIESLRDQMEQCRQICQMIKRREKQKLKLVDCKKELFERNLDFFREGVFLKRELPISENQKQIDPSKAHWENRGKLKKIR